MNKTFFFLTIFVLCLRCQATPIFNLASPQQNLPPESVDKQVSMVSGEHADYPVSFWRRFSDVQIWKTHDVLARKKYPVLITHKNYQGIFKPGISLDEKMIWKDVFWKAPGGHGNPTDDPSFCPPGFPKPHCEIPEPNTGIAILALVAILFITPWRNFRNARRTV